MKGLESIIKVLLAGVAIAALVWVFWNPDDRKPRPQGGKSDVHSDANANVEPPAMFTVTGSVETVRLRSETGRIFGPGEVRPGVYTIVSRTKEAGVQDHGVIYLKSGDSERIDCDANGCRQWQPTPN